MEWKNLVVARVLENTETARIFDGMLLKRLANRIEQLTTTPPQDGSIAFSFSFHVLQKIMHR